MLLSLEHKTHTLSPKQGSMKPAWAAWPGLGTLAFKPSHCPNRDSLTKKHPQRPPSAWLLGEAALPGRLVMETAR